MESVQLKWNFQRIGKVETKKPSVGYWGGGSEGGAEGRVVETFSGMAQNAPLCSNVVHIF